mmetsp:Transcript_38703/g.84183  ORF Transcript_38703/g.84183 Transcript_38703/m.84183 type:complete len:226 (-) Transcript_38703:242-919(-)
MECDPHGAQAGYQERPPPPPLHCPRGVRVHPPRDCDGVQHHRGARHLLAAAHGAASAGPPGQHPLPPQAQEADRRRPEGGGGPAPHAAAGGDERHGAGGGAGVALRGGGGEDRHLRRLPRRLVRGLHPLPLLRGVGGEGRLLPAARHGRQPGGPHVGAVHARGLRGGGPRGEGRAEAQGLALEAVGPLSRASQPVIGLDLTGQTPRLRCDSSSYLYTAQEVATRE